MRPAAIRRRLPFVAAVMAAAAIAAPLGVLASHQFSDVPNANIYHADIAALAGSGVTTGCGGGKYCPSDYVTREQMAAFMNRLGALGPGKTPVVNADEVDGIDEVLEAGEIVTIQQGPWHAAGSAPELTVMHSYDVDTITRASAGANVILLALDGPASIGATGYGLASVEICAESTANVTIGATSVRQTVSPDSHVDRIVDGTDRTPTVAGCYTLTDPNPDLRTGGVHVVLDLGYAQNTAILWMSNVTATWVPVG